MYVVLYDTPYLVLQKIQCRCDLELRMSSLKLDKC